MATITATFEPTEAQLLEAAERMSDFWRERFCEDCDACESHDATGPSYYCGGDPGYDECPADFDPTDGDCVRHDSIYEDDAVVEMAWEMFGPSEDEENPEELEEKAS